MLSLYLRMFKFSYVSTSYEEHPSITSIHQNCAIKQESSSWQYKTICVTNRWTMNIYHIVWKIPIAVFLGRNLVIYEKNYR